MFARMPHVLALGMCAALTVPWHRDVAPTDFVLVERPRESWLTLAWRHGAARSLLS